MSIRRAIKISLLTASTGLALLFMSLPAAAQCALCKTAIAGSPDAGRLSQSLNFAVLILLIPPVLIFCGIFVLAYRYRKSRTAEPDAAPPGKVEKSNWLAKSSSTLKRKEQAKREAKREAGGAAA
jgi:hypothetical protein